jgi:hypothetical protein
MADPNKPSGPVRPRWVAALLFLLASSGWAFTRLPLVAETVHASRVARDLIVSIAPTGAFGVWAGLALVAIGTFAATRRHRFMTGRPSMAVTGTAVLAMVAGGLVALNASVEQHGRQPDSGSPQIARVLPHDSRSRHRRRSQRRRALAHRSPAAGPGQQAVPQAPSAPTNPGSTSPSPAGATAGGNSVTVENSNSQEARSGNATGSGATSGPATNTNNGGNVTITL